MLSFYPLKLLLNFLGHTGPFLVLPTPKTVFGICKWCQRTLLIYTDNFLFLSLHQFTLLSLFPKRVEDRQTDQASYRCDFSSLKNKYQVWSGSMFLGYNKRSYSGFLGYNYYAKYIVFLHGFGALWKSNHTLLISDYTSMAYEKNIF